MSAADTHAVNERLRDACKQHGDLAETYLHTVLILLAHHAPEVVAFALDRVDERLAALDAPAAGGEAGC